MAESSTRKARRIKKDIITKLPRNIQETILCFLPIRDAVRTSVLSRNWRRCWTGIPHLIFDHQFVYSMTDKLCRYRNRELAALKFVSVINKCILLHNGPILKFSLAIPKHYYCDDEIIHDYIDQWIALFSRTGIKQLTLEDYSGLIDLRAHDLSSLDLTHLTLLSVWFPYTPALGRYTCLTNLELVGAASNYGKNIFDCPLLEKLTLIICEGLFPNNFCAPNLTCLHQIYREITSEYSLAGLDNLSEYSLMLTRYPITQTKTSNVVKVLGGVHRIEKLTIAMYFTRYLAAGGSPHRLSKPLSYLKTLNITEMNFYDLSGVSCLLCLIRSAPNLCELHILADKSPDIEDDEETLENYCIDDLEDCTIDHLEIVTFSFFEGLRAELELVRFLLGHSPLLKTMSIDDLTMAEEMLQYPRASSRAQIRRLKHYVVIDEFDYNLWGDSYDVYTS